MIRNPVINALDRIYTGIRRPSIEGRYSRTRLVDKEVAQRFLNTDTEVMLGHSDPNLVEVAAVGLGLMLSPKERRSYKQGEVKVDFYNLQFSPNSQSSRISFMHGDDEVMFTAVTDFASDRYTLLVEIDENRSLELYSDISGPEHFAVRPSV